MATKNIDYATIAKPTSNYYIKLARENVEEFIGPIEKDVRLIIKQNRKARRKINPTYGGWRRKRMFR